MEPSPGPVRLVRAVACVASLMINPHGKHRPVGVGDTKLCAITGISSASENNSDRWRTRMTGCSVLGLRTSDHYRLAFGYKMICIY